MHPHRHTGSCRTDETETSGDFQEWKEILLGNIDVINKSYYFLTVLNLKFKDVLNLDILLKGSLILTVEENTEIFDAVHHFITGSRRFT